MLVMFIAASLIMVMALDSIEPGLRVFDYSPDWMKITTLFTQTFVAVLGITAIQFFLGMQFKNFIVPMGTGFFLYLLLPIALELEWAHLDKFPYSYSIYLLFPKYAAIVPYILMGSAGYAVLFLYISYKRFRTTT